MELHKVGGGELALLHSDDCVLCGKPVLPQQVLIEQIFPKKFNKTVDKITTI